MAKGGRVLQFRYSAPFVLMMLAAFAVSGCVTDGLGAPPTVESVGPVVSPTVQEPKDRKFLPSDESRKLGLEYFNRGDYGTAERYFQDAVEKAPQDSSAWIGLAASYDRIGRFDLSDRAYRNAIRQVGETTEILNDLGYSYMLRGNYALARTYMSRALARDPHNPTIINNIKLLDSSSLPPRS